MIKYQLNITLYEKISLYSIRFDISLSQACCAGITEMPFKVTEMPNGKIQCPGVMSDDPADHPSWPPCL